MNVLKYRSRLYARGFFVLKLRKCRNFNISAGRFGDSQNADQQTANCDDIHVFTKTNEPSLSNYSNLACGYGFTVLCTDHQQLVVSGVNGNSQLGMPSYQNNVVDKLTKVELPFIKSASQIFDISCGRLHTVVSTTEGLFASGCNKLGQCGLGLEKDEITSFTRIPSPTETAVKQVVCGLDHTLLLTEDGDVWSCGWAADGQTGLGHFKEQRSLVPIQMPSHVKINKVATKSDSCLALSNCGEVFSWGNSEYSQLGFSTEETLITKPTKITSLQNIVDIAIGNSIGLALTDDGAVFSWGYGLLGNSFEPSFSPAPQKLTLLEKRVIKLDCGLHFYILLTDEKKVYMWGKLNHTLYSCSPKKVDLPSNVLRISCGIDHMGVIVDD